MRTLVLLALAVLLGSCDPYANKTVVHHFEVQEAHKEVVFYAPDGTRTTAGPAQDLGKDGKIVLFDDNTGYCTSVALNGQGKRQGLTYSILWATGRIRLDFEANPARTIFLEPLPNVPPGPAFSWTATEDLGYDGTGTRKAVEVRLLLEDLAQ
jgi:hypothetical protein